MHRENHLISAGIDFDEFIKIAESPLIDDFPESRLERGGSPYEFVYYLDPEAYQEIHHDCPEEDTTIAFFRCGRDEAGNVTELEIYINLSAFYINECDFSYLIPMVIRHEGSEMYYSLFTDDNAANGFAHQKAVLEEFRLAYSLQLHLDYLHLALLWADKLSSPRREEFINEHHQALRAVLE